ncbi:hypothetical protein OMAG_000276 [Candidatus Omnitrophus magneticus]|uniref:Uncharacterized protein n=1 Tax=Candidatus Omnitrophus magneticus TaxID=1609969 RepID=A0A0F0CV03_9BACT|nr:hypothetical protein OMAG_000276 [Candidatus Omnitrophus magneticus]
MKALSQNEVFCRPLINICGKKLFFQREKIVKKIKKYFFHFATAP